MLIRKVKAPNTEAERFKKLVGRWQDSAAFPNGHEDEKRHAWAGHLKRVAEEHEKSGEK